MWGKILNNTAMAELKNERKNPGHPVHVLTLIIDEHKYEWPNQYINGSEIRKLGKVPPKDEIYLAIKRPWEDELILDDTNIDLARPGIEHFFSKKSHEHRIVSIQINNIERKVKRGKHKVSELKTIGEVPAEHELEELIDGKLTPLDDNAVVLIKGGEEFFSHVRDGSSS